MTPQNRLIPTLLATVAILALAPSMATASMFKRPAPAAETPAPAPAEPPKAAEQPKPDTPAPAVAVEAPSAPAVAAPSAEGQAQPVQQAEPEAKPKAAAKPATKAPAKKAVATVQPRSWSGYAIAPDTASVQFADGVRLQLAGIAATGDAKAVQAMTAYVFQRGGLICREVKAQSSTVTCRTINGGHNLAAAAVHNNVASVLDAKYLR